MCYIVVDLEMCNVPKRLMTATYQHPNEIIQIGAVMLDDNYEIIDTFDSLVNPEIGEITSKITKLTGISKEMVAEKDTIKDVLQRFVDWVPADAKWVSWSENDERQIRREIAGKNISIAGIDKLDGEWIDCQMLFSEILKESKRYNLQYALNISNIDYDDHLHDGLVDASNTALLFKKIKTEQVFTFNEYYINAKKETEPLTFSLGDILERLQLI